MHPRHDHASASGRAAAHGLFAVAALFAMVIAVHLAVPSAAEAASAPEWRQLYFEFQRSPGAAASPSLDTLLDSARERHREGLVPLAVLDVINDAGDRVFAATALTACTYRGAGVRFVLDRDRYVVGTGDAVPRAVLVDFADGAGWREVAIGVPVSAHFAATGAVEIRLRATGADGIPRTASVPFDVRALSTPTPSDTLHVAGTIPYQGRYATGDGYVYLADGHGAITTPVVLIEGFDLDNSMYWDELYALLDQQQLIETLHADGFDAVVLNFTESTNAIQENGFVVENLLEQVRAAAPSTPVVLVGASMGGLCARWALDWMETNGVPHGVRTFISFDSPQKGANIPLGVQYWLDFFSGMSADAAYLLGRLNTAAARQMLLYHYTSPASSTGSPDPLRATMESDFAAIGNWPAAPRLVAIANGSGTMAGQGFNPGDQIIYYQYRSLIVDILGHVWAVPSGATSTRIFAGVTDFILLPPTTESVYVSGTLPWDNAPGGSRPTMAQMDSASTGYGDIIALHPSHAFIPTVSSLALDTTNPFYDIAGDPDLLSHTPFDAVYYPAENQEHVTVTAQSAPWFLNEIRGAVSGVAAAGGAGTAGRGAAPALLSSNHPNPFSRETVIRFVLPAPEAVSLEVFDAAGRRIATLARGPQSAGAHEVVFHRGDAAAGVYFCRLHTAGGRDATIKMTATP